MPKKVEALVQGFCDGKRRRKGDVFVIADNVKVGKWMKVVKDVPAKASQQSDEKDALIEKAKALGIAATKNWGVEKLNAAISEAEAALSEASKQA